MARKYLEDYKPVPREDFISQLWSQYVPSYAYPRFAPSDLPKYFQFARIVRTRLIKSSATKREEIVRIDSKLQEVMWGRLLKIANVPDATFVVSSEVTDMFAMQAAACLNWRWVRLFPDNEFVWHTPRFVPKAVNRDMRFVFIHGILPEPSLLYNIRDILSAYPRAIKVLIMGGIQGLEFTDEYLHIPVHFAFHIEGTREKLPADVSIRTTETTNSMQPGFAKFRVTKSPALEKSETTTLKRLKKG